MPGRSARVEEVFQRLDEDFSGGLRQFPSKIRDWFTSNIIQRAAAFLFAFTEEGKSVRLRATADGKLKVVSASAGFTDYDVFTGDALDDYDPTTTYEFTKPYSRIDLLIEDNDAVVSFKKENGTWGKDLTIKQGYHSIDFVLYGVRVKNRTAGAVAKYEITVYR